MAAHGVFAAILVLASIECLVGLTLPTITIPAHKIGPISIPKRSVGLSADVKLTKEGLVLTEKDSRTKSYRNQDQQHSSNTETSAYGQNGSQDQSSIYDRSELEDGTETHSNERKIKLSLIHGPSIEKTHTDYGSRTKTLEELRRESGHKQDHGQTNDGQYSESASYDVEEGKKHQEKDTHQDVQHKSWGLFNNQRKKDSSSTSNHQQSDSGFKSSNNQEQKSLISNNGGDDSSSTSIPSSTATQPSSAASGVEEKSDSTSSTVNQPSSTASGDDENSDTISSSEDQDSSGLPSAGQTNSSGDGQAYSGLSNASQTSSPSEGRNASVTSKCTTH